MPKEVIKDQQSQGEDSGQKSSKVIEDLLTKRLRKDTHQFNEMIRLLVESNKSRSADPFVKELRKFYQGGGLISDKASTAFLQNLQNVKLEAIGNDEATGLLEEVVSRFDVFLNQQEKEIARTTLNDKNELRERLKEQRLELARHQQRMKQAVERNTRGEGEEKPVKSKSGEDFRKGFSGARDFLADKLEDKEKTHFAASVANAIVPGLGALVANLGYDETKELAGKGFSAISKVVGAGKRAFVKEKPSASPPREMPDPDSLMPHEDDDTEEPKKRVRGKDKKPRKRRGQKPVEESIPDEIERQGNRQVESSDQVMTILKQNLRTTEQIREITSGIRSVVVSSPDEEKRHAEELQLEQQRHEQVMYKKEKADTGRRERKNRAKIDSAQEEISSNVSEFTQDALAEATGSTIGHILTRGGLGAAIGSIVATMKGASIIASLGTVASAVASVVASPAAAAAATTFAGGYVVKKLLDYEHKENAFGLFDEQNRDKNFSLRERTVDGKTVASSLDLPSLEEAVRMAADPERAEQLHSLLEKAGERVNTEIEVLKEEKESNKLDQGFFGPAMTPENMVKAQALEKATNRMNDVNTAGLYLEFLAEKAEEARERSIEAREQVAKQRNRDEILLGGATGAGGMPMPTITSGFGADRGGGKTHNGTDFAASEGQGLPSYFDGVVTEVGSDDTSGNYVRYKTDDGQMIGRAHLSKSNVRVGQRVKPGTIIGLAGNTGASRGPHDHLTYYPDANDLTKPANVVPVLWDAASGGASSRVAAVQQETMADRSGAFAGATETQPSITPEQAERIAMGQDRMVEAVKENTEFQRRNAANQQTAPIDPPSNMDEDGGISHVNMIHQ